MTPPTYPPSYLASNENHGPLPLENHQIIPFENCHLGEVSNQFSDSAKHSIPSQRCPSEFQSQEVSCLDLQGGALQVM